MKIIKRISLLLVTALAVMGICAFASACAPKDFTVTVYYSDGTTVVDGTGDVKYTVQICYYLDAKKELVGCCTTDGAVGADGKATISIAAVEAEAPEGDVKYEVHVIALPNIYAEELKEQVYVSTSNASVSVVLKNVAAPAK